VDLPGEVVHLTPAISDRSEAILRAPFASPPQEVLNVSAEGDLTEIPDPEAETYTNVKSPPASLTWKSPLMTGLPLP